MDVADNRIVALTSNNLKINSRRQVLSYGNYRWKKSAHHIPRDKSIFKAQSSEIRINSKICKEGNNLTPTATLRGKSAVKLTSRVAI